MEHESRADELEREVQDMERRSEHVGTEIDEAREDWQRKQRDPNIPGADQADDFQLDEDRRQPPEANPPGTP